MLDEYKQLYKECASQLGNLKSLDRNALCKYYVDNKDTMSELDKNVYLSAIIYKFWNLISFTYNKQENSNKILTQEDCYELLISSILYVLDKAVWNNEGSSIYGDKKGPEKAVAIRIKSIARNMTHLSLSTDKKKLNSISYSLDELVEESSDGYFLKCEEDMYDEFSDFCKSYIKAKIKSYDYFTAIIFDLMYNGDCFSEDQVDIDCGKIFRQFKNLDLDYVNYFKNQYEVTYNEALNAVNFTKGLSSNNMKGIVDIIKEDIKKSIIIR